MIVLNSCNVDTVSEDMLSLPLISVAIRLSADNISDLGDVGQFASWLQDRLNDYSNGIRDSSDSITYAFDGNLDIGESVAEQIADALNPNDQHDSSNIELDGLKDIENYKLIYVIEYVRLLIDKMKLKKENVIRKKLVRVLSVVADSFQTMYETSVDDFHKIQEQLNIIKSEIGKIKNEQR